jgi:hypothetical protein
MFTLADSKDPQPDVVGWEKVQEENMSKLLELGNFDRDEDTDKI